MTLIGLYIGEENIQLADLSAILALSFSILLIDCNKTLARSSVWYKWYKLSLDMYLEMCQLFDTVFIG